MTLPCDDMQNRISPCWTRLAGSQIYEHAYLTQSSRAEHVFRNWSLTCRYYRNAQDLLQYDYSRALDIAILAWGSTLCIDGALAISWANNHLDRDDPDLGEVNRILNGCAEIDPSLDPRLLLTTLGDLADVELSKHNFSMIKRDFLIQHRMDVRTFYTSFGEFLFRLKDRLRNAPTNNLNAKEQQMLRGILEGIRSLQFHMLDEENKEGTSDG